SGTEALARVLLKQYGVSESTATLVNLALGEMRQALTEGKVDGAFLVCAYDAPVIHELVGDRRIDPGNLGIHQHAVARRFRYLQPIVLPRGVLDLEQDIPARDITLLSPRILLVARAELHPRVVE